MPAEVTFVVRSHKFHIYLSAANNVKYSQTIQKIPETTNTGHLIQRLNRIGHYYI